MCIRDSCNITDFDIDRGKREQTVKNTEWNVNDANMFKRWNKNGLIVDKISLKEVLEKKNNCLSDIKVLCNSGSLETE